LRQKRDFLSGFRLLICCSASASSDLRKWTWRRRQITGLYGHPAPQEGRFANVTDVGAGCGGRGCFRRESADVWSPRVRRSRVVLTPRRWRQVCWAICGWRWQTSPVTGESAE